MSLHWLNLLTLLWLSSLDNRFDDFYLPTDLTKFLTEYEPSAAGTQPKLVSIDGGFDDTTIGGMGFDQAGEADLGA